MSLPYARRVVSVLVVGWATLFVAAPSGGQQASPVAAAATAPLDAALPVDPAITTGQFDNGLRYYIRSNHYPEGRAELRLVVDVGSIVEDEDQRGLAHFVEHMAFNGTENFPQQEIVSFMESIGMAFGPSVNASTSFDETIYMLQVPTDSPAVMDRALLILEDWAHRLSFDAAEIEQERGVVMEEWRSRRGASARVDDEQFPILFQGSRYADRLPIGKTEVLLNFPPERLVEFYRDWYRPDLMAVIAVGDFDVPAMEAMIREHFGSIPPATDPRPRQVYDVPPQPGTLYAISSDPEISNTSVSVYHKMPFRDPRTVGAYRRQIVESIVSGMLTTRLREIADRPDAPFLGASAGRGLFVRSAEVSVLSARVREDGITEGLAAVFAEAERAARFGFTDGELTRQKLGISRSYEQAVIGMDQRPSSRLAAEYIRAYTQDEPIPGIEYEQALVERFLPEITLDEVNAVVADWMPDESRVVTVTAPEKPGLDLPTADALAAAMASGADQPLEAYVDSVTDAPLMATSPAPGTIVETTAREEFGITEWRLSNGVRVVLKPTDLKEDEIIFRAFSPGGTSLATDDQWIAATTAANVVSAGGLGAFSAVDLRKLLTGKVASVNPYIRDLEEGLSGSASVRDLDTLFQLIYLTFTAPRADPERFQAMTDELRANLANQAARPGYVFQLALTSLLSRDHPRARPLTVEAVDEMDLDASMAFYRDRFADAGDFTFVFVGSFDPETLQPLVERYLASLPATGRTETWRDLGIEPVPGVAEREVFKGIEPQSQTAIVFTGAMDYNQTERVALRALADVLQVRLRESLREELGGTYGAGVGPGYAKLPKPEYQVSISFGSDPGRAAELATRVFEEIEILKRDGPSDQQVQDVREQFLRELETQEQTNSFWMTNIVGKYWNDEVDELETLYQLRSYYERISSDMVRDAARRYLDTSRYVKVTLLPES